MIVLSGLGWVQCVPSAMSCQVGGQATRTTCVPACGAARANQLLGIKVHRYNQICQYQSVL